MSTPSGESLNVTPQRLLSLDFFRGATMFLLIGEATELYSRWTEFTRPGTLLHALGEQFHHHPWNGLRFWDLIQPFFMFIVGVAMAYSVRKRRQTMTRQAVTRHILKRCLILFFLGVLLHCGYQERIVWELWNVLTQLSVTILIAYFLMDLRMSTQLIVSLGLLLLTEILYRYTNIPGFDQPFVQGENFGAWMDLVLMGKINSGGWVAINALPTAAHTIWGVLAGKVLQQYSSPRRILGIMLSAGAAGLVIGYGLDLAGITPIIKRICTSSFVLASGGWCLIVLAFSYWLIDLRGSKSWVIFFAIVGMNPIFIYMFSQILTYQWLNEYAEIYTGSIGEWLGLSTHAILIITSLLVWAFEWLLCYWLYKRRIFIKV